MTTLSSKFNFYGHDPHAAAPGSLTTVLPVQGAVGPYTGAGGSGTPVAGTIFRGAIVNMDPSSGEAVIADYDITSVIYGGATKAKTMFFVTPDGDVDFDGAYVHKITCIQGGFELVTDQFTTDPGMVPGAPLRPGGTIGGDAGMFVLADPSTDQVYGYVGKDGINTTTGLLHVIIPQGV